MTAISKTRYKFFLVMSAIIFVIIFAFCASILGSIYIRNNAASDNILSKMIEESMLLEDGPARPYSIENLNAARGFTVIYNQNNQVLIINSKSDYYGTDMIKNVFLRVQEKNKENGKIDSFKFQVTNTKNEMVIAFLDVSMESAMQTELLSTIMLAGSSIILFLLIIVWLSSYWIIRPMAMSFEKQKCFISQAGHELKTPISVISASIGLIDKTPDNEKWLEAITQQTQKLKLMTENLLTLSKLDEQAAAQKEELNLSGIILTECLAFESIAFENGKSLNTEITDGICYKGASLEIRQAVALLIENAIKHSSPNSKICVKLTKQHNKPTFTAENESMYLREDEVPLFFERFYRGCDSRAQTDGAGLGLSILTAIANNNKWDIGVTTNNNKIKFSITF